MAAAPELRDARRLRPYVHPPFRYNRTHTIRNAVMSDIVIATLNARYYHASMGLRCLLANMDELADRTRLMEFIIDARPADVVEQLLAAEPRVIGLGVYIWNVEITAQIVARLADVVVQLLAAESRVIGLGVYIWNKKNTTQSVALLIEVRPDLIVVVG